MHLQVGKTLHRMSNFVATPTTTGAAMRTYVDAILRSLQEGAPTHHAAGYYDDVLIRTHDGWKIKQRRFTQLDI